jgi:hypothetical protein
MHSLQRTHKKEEMKLDKRICRKKGGPKGDGLINIGTEPDGLVLITITGEYSVVTAKRMQLVGRNKRKT